MEHQTMTEPRDHLASTTRDTERVEVRRSITINGVVGAIAATMAVAYLSRATSTGGGLDWTLCGAMTLIAIVQFAALMDARVPLLIVDDEGVRFRLGSEWVGLPWLTIGQVVTEHRDLPWREGRLVVVPRNPAHVLDTLSPSARREVAWQRRLHGAPLSVPLSLFTRCSSSQVAHDLKRLAAGRADVVALRGRERAQLDVERTPRRERQPADQAAPVVPPEPVDEALPLREHEPDALPAPVAVVETPQPEPEPVVEAEPEAEADPEPEPSPEPRRSAPRLDPVAAVRAARAVMRLDVVRDARPRIVPEPSPVPAPVAAAPAEAVAVVHDTAEPVPEPAVEPVIGPEIAAARQRAGLTVDALSERTRIRPHVLEGIEVDDFAPCGGDFYARGHLSTLARYLGLDGEQLRQQYDETYASGEINARRVFEAELATGLSGGMRATSGGPRWTLLVGAAMALTMIWGVARYFTDEPPQVSAPTVSDSAGLSANRQPITSPLTETSEVTIRALERRVTVTVTDRSGVQLFSGRVAAGDKVTVVGVGPFTVSSNLGDQARVWVDGTRLGTVGQGVASASREVG